jgi:hypothetical protein
VPLYLVAYNPAFIYKACHDGAQIYCHATMMLKTHVGHNVEKAEPTNGTVLFSSFQNLAKEHKTH